MWKIPIISLVIFAVVTISYGEWRDAVLYQKLAVDRGIEHKVGEIITVIWNLDDEAGELCIEKEGQTIMCIDYVEGTGKIEFDTGILSPGAYLLHIEDDNGDTIASTPLIIETTGSSLDVKPVPNPFDLSSGEGTLTFFGMPSDATLRIYDFGGNLVYKVVGGYTWDGRNMDGEMVSSGAYIFHIESEGEEFIGRFAVIK